MNHWQTNPYIYSTPDRISEEVFSDNYLPPTDATDSFPQCTLTELLENPDILNINLAGECDSVALIGKCGIFDVFFHLFHSSCRLSQKQY
jgi:hypothetical protein